MAGATPKALREKRLDGAPGEIRTPDLTLRRRSLYPAELRARSTSISHFGSRARSTDRGALRALRLPLHPQLFHHRLDQYLGSIHAAQNGLEVQRRLGRIAS